MPCCQPRIVLAHRATETKKICTRKSKGGPIEIASRHIPAAIRLLGSEIIFAAARVVGVGRGHIQRCNHRTVSTSETNSMGRFERMELRQVASFMGLGSGARGVAGELHLQGGEHGLGAGGRADLDRHPDEVEPAG
jgi:hypothetical protein